MIQGIGVNMEMTDTTIRLSALQMAMALYTNKEGVTTATLDQVMTAANAYVDFILTKPDKANVSPLKAVT